MKKLMIFAAALLCGISSYAQTPGEDSWVDVDPVGCSFGPAHIESFGNYGFGFSQISADNNALDINMGRSFSFYMDMLSIDVNLTRSGHLQLHSALRWTFDNLVTDDNVAFASEGKAVYAVPVVGDLKKSKMRADYLGIPLGFVYRNSGFRVYANVIGELRTGSITKVKYEGGDKNKEKLGGLENLRASAECGVGYKNIAVFFKHTLTPTFVNTGFASSDVNVMTVGVAVGF